MPRYLPFSMLFSSFFSQTISFHQVSSPLAFLVVLVHFNKPSQVMVFFNLETPLHCLHPLRIFSLNKEFSMVVSFRTFTCFILLWSPHQPFIRLPVYNVLFILLLSRFVLYLCLDLGFFVFIPLGVCWAFYICKFVSFIAFLKFSTIISSNIFSVPFSLCFPSVIPTIPMLYSLR